MPLPTIITNVSKKKTDLTVGSHFTGFTVNDAINKLLSRSPSYLNILTGYFNPTVWKIVGDKIVLLSANESDYVFRMLIGYKGVKKFDPVALQQSFDKDLAEADFEHADHIQQLQRFLRREDVDIRLLTSPFMHGKLYLFPKTAIVGSSNFTIPGLVRNNELNLVTSTASTVSELGEWFEHYWQRGKPYKDTLYEILDKSWLGLYEWTPHEVYTKIAFEYYKPDLVTDITTSMLDLAEFQREGVLRALNIIDKHGGVLVSDAVGLGKSYTGTEIAYQTLLRSKSRLPGVMIICPAQLRTFWKNASIRFNLRATLVSAEMMSRDIPIGSYDVVLIDESHNFRNHKTKRYGNLLTFLTRNHDAKVILLTATPINTSKMDMYHQLKLITRGNDRMISLEDVGITDLKDYFDRLMEDEADFQLIKEAMMVCRSRAEIRFRQSLGQDLCFAGGIRIKFPDRLLNSIDYTIVDPASGTTSADFYTKISDLLNKLKYPQFNLENYRLPEFKVDLQSAQRGKAVTNMIQTLFLKRLESSLHAFSLSINAQLKLLERFHPYFQKNYVLTTPVIHAILTEDDALDWSDGFDENFLVDFASTKDVVMKLCRQIKASEYRSDDLLRDLQADQEIMEEIDAEINAVKEQSDRKLDQLISELDNIMAANNNRPADTPATKVIIFSYFRSTADYIYEQLTTPGTSYYRDGWKYGLITGSTPSKKRLALVYRFAPEANAENLTNEEKTRLDEEPQLDILICTDVLSEGMNLQDANHVINYDLHWNPVRMIQRAGRIDRLKSPHADSTITVHNFFVEDGLEALLGLMERIIERLDSIDTTIELDARVMETRKTQRARENLKRAKIDLNRLHRGDLAVWDEYEAEIEKKKK
ncbi:MAG: helicase-related protein, partial [Candidatus Hodarchaeales archaeon]